jgi:hypothetical protein
MIGFIRLNNNNNKRREKKNGAGRDGEVSRHGN